MEDLASDVNLNSSMMDKNASWSSTYSIYYYRDNLSLDELSHGLSDNSAMSDAIISIDSILTDDLLEKLFSFLPVASIFRAASVCTRWCKVSRSMKFCLVDRREQKPWYFMFTCNDSPLGYIFDPNLRKWYNFDLPCIERSNWLISSSWGLVCFIDIDNWSHIFVCNPLTRDWRRVKEPPGVKFPDYSVLALSVNLSTQGYTIALTKSKLVSDDFLHYEFSVHVYESGCGFWSTALKEVLMGWRGEEDGVISNGVLYCLIHRTGVLGNLDLRHGLLAYDLSNHSSHSSSLIAIPFPITCGRLMNLRSKLVMVGGIAKHDKPDVIKGIGIWELHESEWREVARMPHRFFQGFGEFDDVFASSGAGDLVFIQSYGGPALLMYDLNQKLWKWSTKCPVSKRLPLQLFTGFCFEPALEITS